MDTDKKIRLTPQLVIGLLVVALGVLFALENAGWAEADQLLRYWPLGLIIVGLVKIMTTSYIPGRLAGGAITALGLILLADSALGYDIDFWTYVPSLVLVFVGSMLVWQALSRGSARRSKSGDIDDNDYLNAVAVMGGVERASASQDFRGGELTAFMGGCEIDLTKASIRGEEAVIDMFVMWGGIELRVPEDWTLVVKGLPIMGAMIDKTRPPRPDEGREKRLLIRGMALMGGVEIKN